MIRRKWLVRLHMSSGSTIKIFVNDLAIRRDGKNCITELQYPGAAILDYVRLDEIEAITSRPCWVRWCRT